VYLNSDINRSGTARISDAFNANDGPEPYRIISIEATKYEQTIFDIDLEDTPEGSLYFSGKTTAFIRVEYENGDGEVRSKYVNFPIPVESTFIADEKIDVLDLKFYCYLIDAVLDDINLSDNILTFSYDLMLTLLVINSKSSSFALFDVCEDAQLPTPTKQATFMPIKKHCNNVPEITLLGCGTIPFENKSPGSHIDVVNFRILDGFTFLGVLEDMSGRSILSIAFPVYIALQYDHAEIFEQESNLYIEMELFGSLSPDTMIFLKDFVFEYDYFPWAGSNYLHLCPSELSGTFCLTEGMVITRFLSDFVDCGTCAMPSCCIKYEIRNYGE